MTLSEVVMQQKVFEGLRKELAQTPVGSYAPYYFRYLGYRENLSAEISELRANGIYSLFTSPVPVILKNEYFAGNKKSLFCEEDALVLNYAKRTADHVPQRSFGTNADHYAPNYDHILSVGVGGLIHKIDASMEAHQKSPERVAFLRAMKKTLLGFQGMIENYIAEAEKLKGDPSYDKDRLQFITENCRAIVSAAPKSFAQAL